MKRGEERWEKRGVRSTTNSPPEYRAQTADIVRTRMLYAMLGFLAVMAVASVPELSNHPLRARAYGGVYAVEAAVWILAVVVVRSRVGRSSPVMLVPIVTTMIMIAMITGYHIVLHGEAEVVELALLYVVVSSMVLFPWGGRGQAIVASAGVAAFVVALASGLELRTPVGLHLLGLGTAVLLTVGGAIFLEQYRFSVFRQAEELRRVNEAKTQLLANVSHELRTPLNVVIGYQQLLTEGAFGDLPPAAQDTMSRVMAYSRMLLTLIDDFLDLSRLEKQRLTLRMEPIELRGLCAEVGALIEPLLRDKQVQFRCYINNGEVAYADRDRLRQVLLNLLTNAIKFTDRGSIELRSHRPEQQRLVIEVEDTGVGIAAAEQEAIFQPFRRGAQSMHVRGVGIGLALSRQLTEAMGGRLSVSSTPGHGSTFSIQLAAS